MLPRLYVFTSQAAAARALLSAAGLRPGFHSLVPVGQREQLHGLQGCSFAIVKNHPRAVPSEMMEAVRATGMCLIELSDEFARAKAKLRRPA